MNSALQPGTQDTTQAVEPDYFSMSGPELLVALGTDAQKWAVAFCQIKERQSWSLSDIDVGLMTTWFANSIVTAQDDCHDAMPQAEELIEKLKAAVSGLLNDYRTEVCPDKDCLVCKASSAVKATALNALKEAGERE